MIRSLINRRLLKSVPYFKTSLLVEKKNSVIQNQPEKIELPPAVTQIFKSIQAEVQHEANELNQLANEVIASQKQNIAINFDEKVIFNAKKYTDTIFNKSIFPLFGTLSTSILFDWQLWYGSYSYTTMGITALACLYCADKLIRIGTINQGNLVQSIERQAQKYKIICSFGQQFIVDRNDILFNVPLTVAKKHNPFASRIDNVYFCLIKNQLYYIPQQSIENNIQFRKLF